MIHRQGTWGGHAGTRSTRSAPVSVHRGSRSRFASPRSPKPPFSPTDMSIRRYQWEPFSGVVGLGKREKGGEMMEFDAQRAHQPTLDTSAQLGETTMELTHTLLACLDASV